jgi:CRISPR system Cascade subunit CasA
MSEERHCLLDEPLITVRRPTGRTTTASLPEILAGLASGNVAAFAALQPHQRQPWHAFLAQLAAIALARADDESLPEDPDTWRQRLLELTGGDRAPWCMVVQDLSRPAFMQPPVPEGSLEEAKFSKDVPTPDELDMLVTSRNHDVKKARMSRPEVEHWLYALVSLQTMEGFLGRGNYGIIRMNGGFGNRPMVGMIPALDWPSRFRRDIGILVSARERLVDAYGYSPTGPALLWLPPWDGGKQSGIPLHECDPLFVEICRRIRFLPGQDGVRCLRTNTKGTRIAAPDDLRGITGDPWTPINKRDSRVLRVDENGFSYELLREILLSGEYESSAALTSEGLEEHGGYLLATALVRGKGKTKGFHHRIVPVPVNAARIFRQPDEKEILAERAEERAQLAADVQRKVLYPALRALLSADSDEHVDSDQVARWTRAYDSAVDDAFFPELWASIDMPEEQAKKRWQQRLFDCAEQQFKDAVQSCPLPSIRRYRATSSAQSIFYGSAHNILNEIFDVSTANVEEAQHVPAAN